MIDILKAATDLLSPPINSLNLQPLNNNMANPVALTINELTSNTAIAQPAAQTVDTNGTINCAAKSGTGRLVIEIVNAAATVLTVTVKAGTGAQAHTARDLVVTVPVSPGARILGGLESARFVKADGSIDLQFQAASGAPNASVRVYRLSSHA